MASSNRKQREIQQREEQILDAAHHILQELGYLGLNMDRVAEAVEYSKGTIYNHFLCKEEILLALAVRTLNQRTDMFDRAARFRGRPRERLTAVGLASELFVRLYPDHFHVEQILRSSSIWEKTSEKRRTEMEACETRCMSIVTGLVRDAIAAGDLVLPARLSPEDLVFGLWSMTFGAYSIIATDKILPTLGIQHPYQAVIQCGMGLLDGVGWKPLSSEHDYLAVLQEISQAVFPEESQVLSNDRQ